MRPSHVLVCAILFVSMLLQGALGSIRKLPTCQVSDDEGSRNQCTSTQIGSMPVVDVDQISWQGVGVSITEKSSLRKLRNLSNMSAKLDGHGWLSSATDVELLRFLRAKHGNEDKAWKMILKHVEWRNSKYGADSEFTATFFKDSPLHKEVFWMGLNKENCPTLVVRTQIHDGIYYNEDPNIFVR